MKASKQATGQRELVMWSYPDTQHREHQRRPIYVHDSGFKHVFMQSIASSFGLVSKDTVEEDDHGAEWCNWRIVRLTARSEQLAPNKVRTFRAAGVRARMKASNKCPTINIIAYRVLLAQAFALGKNIREQCLIFPTHARAKRWLTENGLVA